MKVKIYALGEGVSPSHDLLIQIDLTEDECKEVRPDWGKYYPVVVYSKVERSLRARGLLSDGGKFAFQVEEVQ